jgi:hypothetical protein
MKELKNRDSMRALNFLKRQQPQSRQSRQEAIGIGPSKNEPDDTVAASFDCVVVCSGNTDHDDVDNTLGDWPRHQHRRGRLAAASTSTKLIA